MLSLRKNGLFCLPIDKPKIKPHLKKLPVISKTRTSRRRNPYWEIKRDLCFHCKNIFWASRYENSKPWTTFCSARCRGSYAASKGNSALNGKNGATKMSQIASSRRMININGKRKWQLIELQSSTAKAPNERV